MNKNNILRLILIISFVFTASNSLANTLKPFQSDGCSAFPDGTPQQNDLWLACCIAHDFSYWQGGTFEQRKTADLELKQCVANVASKEVANLMLAGVRVGGSPFFPTPFRWGYGWPYPRLYGELSLQELKQIKASIETLNPLNRPLD